MSDFEDNTQNTAVNGVQDITRIWDEHKAKLDGLAEDIKTSEQLYHDAESAKTRELESIENEKHEAMQRVKDEYAEKLAEATTRLGQPVEEARDAVKQGIEDYKGAIDTALATGVITKEGLAVLGHTKPKGRFRL